MANFRSNALLFLVCSTLLYTVSAANHEISLRFSINPIAIAASNSSQSILESEGGEFGLKFRSLDGNSFLLAIVYLHYNETTVWSANRNKPVSSNAKLVVSRERNLVLKDGDRDGFFIWSANVTGASRMMLSPKGNLLIYNGSGGILWQSFDHPTDTLLPSQRVRAGTFLVSSLSASNTSESIYMAGVLPGGSGFFAMAPQFFPYGILEFNTLRESAREAYISFYNSSCNHTTMAFSDNGQLLECRQDGKATQECMTETGGNPYGFSISVSTDSSKGFRYIRMEPDGNLKLYLQTPSRLKVERDFFVDFFNDLCRLPNYCGPYGICTDPGAQCTCPAPESSYFSQPDRASAAGCKRKQGLRCNSSHTLVELRGIDYFPCKYLDPLQVSLDQCKSLCLSNCSCVAAFYWQSSGSCFHYEELLSMKTVSDQTQLGFIKVMNESAQPEGHGSRFWKRPWNIVGVSIGAILLFILVVLLILFALLRKMQQTTKAAAAKEDDGFLKTLSVLPPRFTFDELKAITRDFSRKLGAGGFGSVYEGILRDGTMVGVKQLEEASQGYGEFRTEIATLGSLSHVNLVRLRGFCAEESHHLLVYEYMANRSLDGWLFSGDVARLLSWGKRLSIAVDTARGLAFLHEECRECIVHFDVKPENILLDEKFRAKLSDFGLSKLIDRSDQHSRILTRMRGTPGYLAPEWLMETGVGSKSDVYSLGIVLLELVSGRRCVDLSAPEEDCYLPAATIRRFQEAKLMEIVDPRLVYGMREDEARKVVMVALWCIQEEPAMRPKASAVSRMLEGHLQIHAPPMASLQSVLSKQRQIWITAVSAGNRNVQNKLWPS